MRDFAAEAVEEVLRDLVVPRLKELLGEHNPGVEEMVGLIRRAAYNDAVMRLARDCNLDQYAQPLVRQ